MRMVRFGRIEAIIAMTLSVVSSSAVAQTPLEQQVLAALNFARSDPAGYAESLRKYRGYFHAKLVSLPGSKEDLETDEGVAVVDETIGFLAHEAALTSLGDSALLASSAADHVLDQAQSGATGHDGSDGSTPGDRVKRHGGGDYVAEVIAYGAVDAVDVVRQLIVDDGVSDRGHRSVIYSPDLRFAGVSCGPHKEFRTMCVIDMAVSADGRFAHEMRMASVFPSHPAGGN